MIELSPTTALMLYLGLSLLFLLGVWAYNYYAALKKRILPSEKELIVCEFCHFAYLDVSEKKISRCPRCNSLNTMDS